MSAGEFWTNFTLQSYNCFYAIMVWDMLISLRKEKHRIWDREWSIVKCIYIFNRWYGLAAMTMNLCFYNIHVPRAECQKYVRAEPASSIPMILSYQSILLVRCFAVWSRDKAILFIGLAMMTAQLIVQAYATSMMFPTPFPPASLNSSLPTSTSSASDVGPCVVNGAKAWIASYFLFPTCTDTILTVLTFARVLYITRSTKTRLVVEFMKEGFAFFMVVFVANALNGILYLQSDRDISTIASGFAIIMGNVCANHLILRNLKRVKVRHYISSEGRPIYLSTITNINSEAVFTTRLDDTVSDTMSAGHTTRKYPSTWTAHQTDTVAATATTSTTVTR